jgi:hypothetical protein
MQKIGDADLVNCAAADNHRGAFTERQCFL